jgi:hypothetical protein
MKSESFQSYLHLPAKTPAACELAVGSPSVPCEQLRARGWHLRDPLETTRDPWTYQQYIQQSKAEFAVAKQGYATTRCGWFSERSAAYLASGRPVLVQDTAFGEWLHADGGVLAFNSPEEALAGIDEINRNYKFHCQAARDVAAEYFAADKILTHLIERALL